MPVGLPSAARRAYASTVHARHSGQPVATGQDAVRLPLPRACTATSRGDDVHRATGVPAPGRVPA